MNFTLYLKKLWIMCTLIRRSYKFFKMIINLMQWSSDLIKSSFIEKSIIDIVYEDYYVLNSSTVWIRLLCQLNNDVRHESSVRHGRSRNMHGTSAPTVSSTITISADSIRRHPRRIDSRVSLGYVDSHCWQKPLLWLFKLTTDGRTWFSWILKLQTSLNFKLFIFKTCN